MGKIIQVIEWHRELNKPYLVLCSNGKIWQLDFNYTYIMWKEIKSDYPTNSISD